MENLNSERLIYRRQYIITDKRIRDLSGWQRHFVCRGEKTLYAHPDLDVLKFGDGERKMIFMGYIFDWRNPSEGNREILERAFEGQSFQDVLEATYELSGRFVIIYEDGDSCRLFHDAGGQREVHYHVRDGKVSCASQLTIMKEYLGVERTDDVQAIELYESKEFIRSKKQWPGESTIYKDVRCLRPNHFLDMETGESMRYWPVEPLEDLDVEEAACRAAKMIKGFMSSAGMRKNLLIPVTAGWDSRLLLSATRGMKEDVKYFVIKFPHMDENDMDIAIPRRLMERLGCDFEIIKADSQVDEEFRRIFMRNTAYPRVDNLPGIYNVFYNEFSHMMNISSHLSEIVRNYAGRVEKPCGKYLSEYIGYKGFNEYVVRTCEEWLGKNRDVSEDMNIDLLTLFDWEESNWEASHRTETDIALEEYCPLSCRRLMEIMVSVDPIHRNKYDCGLYKRIMKKLWPQVLREPINPSIKTKIEGILVANRMMQPLKKIKKKINIKKIIKKGQI